MDIRNNTQEILKILENNFSNQTIPVARNLALVGLSTIMAESAKTPDIISQMCKINSKSFDTNEMRLSRFLDSDNFQVDDKLWRSHFNMIFEILKENGLKQGDMIAINVDMTSDKDDFLILSASIPFHKRGIPLYNTMRCYPKKKGELNQKKMEQAFMNGLRHILPKGYTYIIVADRGFGNSRFIDLCEKHDFLYLLRLSDGINVQLENEPKKPLKTAHNKDYHDSISVYVPAWDRKVRLVTRKTENAKQAWHIVTNAHNISGLDLILQYGTRFNIEKMFQDEKGSGFLIEDSKIGKYSRYRRLIFLVYLAQAMLMFVGDFIEDNACELKKNFQWHINVLSAFSKWESGQQQCLQKKC